MNAKLDGEFPGVHENRYRFRRRRVTERLTGSPPESGLADGAWLTTTLSRISAAR